MAEKKGKRKPGRPRVLTSRDLKAVCELVQAQPDIPLRQVAVRMEERIGKRLTITTWSRVLAEMGIRKIRPAKSDPEARQDIKATRYRAVHRREPEPGRYPSSLTDHEWEALRPLLLESPETRGRPVKYDRRLMWDAVFYLVRSGASWRMLPSDLPPYKAVFTFFTRARDSGLLERIYERLHALWREKSQRHASPSAGIVDSQSVKTTEKGGFADTTRAKK